MRAEVTAYTSEVVTTESDRESALQGFSLKPATAMTHLAIYALVFFDGFGASAHPSLLTIPTRARSI